MNMLWHEDYLKLRHADFEKSYDLLQKEKQALLGKSLCLLHIINIQS